MYCRSFTISTITTHSFTHANQDRQTCNGAAVALRKWCSWPIELSDRKKDAIHGSFLGHSLSGHSGWTRYLSAEPPEARGLLGGCQLTVIFACSSCRSLNFACRPSRSSFLGCISVGTGTGIGAVRARPCIRDESMRAPAKDATTIAMPMGSRSSHVPS